MTDAVLDTCEMLLAALDPEQARWPWPPRRGLRAGRPGTGRDPAITADRLRGRGRHGDPAHVPALTFTVRAPGTARQAQAAERGCVREAWLVREARLVREAWLVPAGWDRAGAASTFHAAALRQLNYFWPRVVAAGRRS